MVLIKALLMVGIVAQLGCVPHKPIKVDAPIRCLRPIKIENFTKPCKPISPSRAMCDGVLIEYDCVEYKRP